MGVLRTVDIGPMHGLVFASSLGLLSLNFCTVCRRIGLMAVDAPLGGMVIGMG